MTAYLHQRNFEKCWYKMLFLHGQVLRASCKVHPLTLNNAKKSHTVMQRSELWVQVKWTQWSVSMCFFCSFLGVSSALLFEVQWLNKIYKRILSFVKKQDERFQWERICKRGSEFFFFLNSGGDFPKVVGGELAMGRIFLIPEVLP